MEFVVDFQAPVRYLLPVETGRPLAVRVARSLTFAQKMTAKVRKPLPLTLGAICFVVGIGTPFLTGFDRSETGLWIVLLWFILGGFVFVWAAFRKTPEFEITSELISIRGSRFDRNNINFARVFRVFYDGGRVRYIEIQFKEMPRLSIGWKIAKIFERFGFPKKCELGVPLAGEPRIIAPHNSTDVSDAELNRELTKSEQAAGERRPSL